jgi:peroxiredoxin Q/BCP
MFENKSENTILNIGDTVPDFVANVQNPDGSVEQITLSKFIAGQNPLKKPAKVLLIFYPADQTPGCTAQLCGVRDSFANYQSVGVIPLGVNPSTAKSHLDFIQKHNYQFAIVVDEDKTIREKYGATKMFFSNKTTKRGVFLIDENMKLIYQKWGQQDNALIIEMLQKGEI